METGVRYYGTHLREGKMDVSNISNQETMHAIHVAVCP